MQAASILLEDTHCFSKTFLDYLSSKKELRSYYASDPRIENFEEMLNEGRLSIENRETLSRVLESQYKDLKTPISVSDNIMRLKQTGTYTLTTGHQLNIFTGPLYFIYKIVTVINACKTLKKRYPKCDFVPLYWMASEDHDFEEINHFSFGGHTLKWETDQRGAVGRFLTDGLSKIAESLPNGADFFRMAYKQKRLKDAVREYVTHLFGDEGLVVIDGDDVELKKSLKEVIIDDLFTHSAEQLVSKTSEDLKKAGHKPQVGVRNVNFFYLHEDTRQRIERVADKGFELTDTRRFFSEKEMRQLVETHPERFSPNVILRPLYQEIILPNVAYVGGPSEICYWLQLKSVFDHFHTPFPILMPRNFATVLTAKAIKKWNNMGLDPQDLFLGSNDAFTKWVLHHSSHSMDYLQEIDQLKKLESQTKAKAAKTDPTLSQHVESIYARFINRLKKAEKKIQQAEKRKHLEKHRQITSVTREVFPEGVLQERKENFLSFYLENPTFILELKERLDPFSYQMYLLWK